MKFMAKIIGCGVVLVWMQGAMAAPLPASAPAAAQPGATSAERMSVNPYRDKVDRTRIEKRISDRAARTKKRSQEAEKDAAQRAGGTP